MATPKRIDVSCLTDAEWALVADLFEVSGGRGVPPCHSRRTLLEACCYGLLKLECSPVDLPLDFAYTLLEELTINTRTKPMGLVPALLIICGPVAIMVLLSSRYPTMIERRVEANNRAKAAYVKPEPVETTLELITPDGKRISLEECRRAGGSCSPALGKPAG